MDGENDDGESDEESYCGRIENLLEKIGNLPRLSPTTPAEKRRTDAVDRIQMPRKLHRGKVHGFIFTSQLKSDFSSRFFPLARLLCILL